ncbi:MAG: hypothetical protein ACI9TA_003297 [Reinekea sp.]|jgi:hypothetical protein
MSAYSGAIRRRSSTLSPLVAISALSLRESRHSISVDDVTAPDGLSAHLISAALGFLDGR